MRYFYPIIGHKAEVVGIEIAKSLLEWNLEKIFTITFINAKSLMMLHYNTQQEEQMTGKVVFWMNFFICEVLRTLLLFLCKVKRTASTLHLSCTLEHVERFNFHTKEC